MKKEILLLAIKDPNIINIKAKVKNNESFYFLSLKKTSNLLKKK